MPKTVAEIDAQIKQLQARKQKLAVREAAQSRRLRTRQAAILGGWLMANEPETVKRIVAALVRPQDRAAFAPPPAPQAPAAATAPTPEVQA